MTVIRTFVFFIVFSGFTLVSVSSGVQLTRVVKLKQGDIVGEIVEPNHKLLPKIEKFLGIPYASPPVGSQRFMPPGSPPPWMGEKIANSFGPVCPQNFPINNTTVASTNISTGRYKYLKRLLPYLQNQDEDCLYLNIYAPARGKFFSKYLLPTITFLRSFDKNHSNIIVIIILCRSSNYLTIYFEILLQLGKAG